MTTTQQKNLIAITKRALALLDPEWIVTGELKGELLKAMRAVDTDTAKPAKKAASRKMKKAELYTYRPIVSDVKHVEPKGKVTARDGLSYWTAASS